MRERPPWHFLPALALTLAAALASLILSTAWIGQPFPGFLIYTDGRVDGQQFLKADDVSPLFRIGDWITACDGLPMPDGRAVYRYAASRPVGTVVRYRIVRDFDRSPPAVVTRELPTRRFRLDEWWAFPVIMWLDGVAHILLGAFVLVKRPGDRGALAHWFFCLTLGLFLISSPEAILGQHVSRLTMATAEVMIGVTGLGLAMRIPRPWPVLTERPRLAAWQAGIGTLVAGFLLLMMGLTGGAHWDFAVLLYAAVGALTIPASALWARSSASSEPRQRRSATVILWGTALAFLPSTALACVQSLLHVTVPHQELGLFSLLLAPASIAVAIIRHQLFDIQQVVRRTTLYAVLLTCLGVVYAAVTAAGVALFDRLPLAGLATDMAGLGGAFAVSLLFRPLHDRLRRRIDRIFLGHRADDLQVLGDVGRIVPGSQGEVGRSLLDVIERALQPGWAAIVADGTVLAASGDGPDPAGLRPDDRAQADIGPLGDLLPTADDQALYVRLPSRAGSAAWLCLGVKRNEMPYTREEKDLLRAMAVQGGVALESAFVRSRHGDLLVQEGIARSLAEERRQVLRQVLHDLRTDLMNIALSADLARRRPGAVRPLAAIRESIGRIERFLEEKTPGSPTGEACTPVAPALQRVARILGDQLRQKDQVLSLSLPDERWHVGLTAVELDQVLTNLVGNAGKFAPAQTTIRVSVRRDGDRLVLAVADEGPGIPPHLLDHLGSGKRADPALPGWGFGLQNVRDLAAKAGGELTWRNESHGAVVTVVLPAVTATQPITG
jgi:signal transduction histidine kinase